MLKRKTALAVAVGALVALPLASADGLSPDTAVYNATDPPVLPDVGIGMSATTATSVIGTLKVPDATIGIETSATIAASVIGSLKVPDVVSNPAIGIELSDDVASVPTVDASESTYFSAISETRGNAREVSRSERSTPAALMGKMNADGMYGASNKAFTGIGGATIAPG